MNNTNITKSISKYSKELIAIIIGLAFAYCWQLFAILMVWLVEEYVMVEFFIPNIGVFFAISPIIAWLFCGLFKVSWFEKWIRITAFAFTFLIPFIIISALVLFIGKASFWHMPVFWIINVLLSIIIGVVFLNPLLHIAFPKKQKISKKQ